MPGMNYLLLSRPSVKIKKKNLGFYFEKKVSICFIYFAHINGYL